jgi:predicted glutamine amidotransferase
MPPSATPTRFVWTHVRQALQQTVAIGACSPYFDVTWETRIVAICFTP